MNNASQSRANEIKINSNYKKVPIAKHAAFTCICTPNIKSAVLYRSHIPDVMRTR